MMGVRRGQAAGWCHDGLAEGAQAARSLGARREPAPSSREGTRSSTRYDGAGGERRRRADKVDTVSGCGAVMDSRRGARDGGECHGGGRGAQERARLGARREPAPTQRASRSTRYDGAGGDERRRRGRSTRASGGGAGMGVKWSSGTQGEVTVVTRERERRAQLGARRGPAPGSQQGEQRRRAATARAAAAASARKVDALLGCGAVMGIAEHAKVMSRW